MRITGSKFRFVTVCLLLSFGHSSSAQTKKADGVTIAGTITNPGNYRYEPRMTLKDLIIKAGGLKKSHTVRLTGAVNPGQYSHHPGMTVSDLLEKARSIASTQKISIKGTVKDPGQYLYESRMTVKDAVVKAGGFAN